MSNLYDTVGFWHYLESFTGCRLVMRPQMCASSTMVDPAPRYEMALWAYSPMRPNRPVIVARVELRSYVPYVDDTELNEMLDRVVPFLSERVDLLPDTCQLYQQLYDVPLPPVAPLDKGTQAETD